VTAGALSGRAVAVVGGGLAGITAAIDLREAGLDVTLLEARPRLGGAATSYQRGAMTIDNGQHVFLRCCVNYAGLLSKLGVTGSVAIQDKFDVTVLSPSGRARLRRSSLPSPLHFAGALARYRLLPLADRARVGRAALAFRFARPEDARLDRERLGDWLGSRGQSERARRLLWDLFIVSALNIAGDDASVQLAATVIKTAMLGASDAADIGMAAVPLGELHADATAKLLDHLGATVRLSARADVIEPLPGGGFRVGEFQSDHSTTADAVVLAVPASRAGPLAKAAGVPAAATGPWSNLGASPIVNVHVIYDRTVMDLPFAAAVDSPVQWIFDKTRQAGLTSGQYLAISQSAASDLADQPVSALRAKFIPALEQLLPAAAGAGITDFFVTREPRATFWQGPGSGALRPGTATGARGIVLAGSWTDTGWPDTMEGAVISGHNAARELIRQLATRPDGGTAGAALTGGGIVAQQELAAGNSAAAGQDAAWSGTA
jgi:squalene-associated FAD-dependent desaturase